MEAGWPRARVKGMVICLPRCASATDTYRQTHAHTRSNSLMCVPAAVNDRFDDLCQLICTPDRRLADEAVMGTCM